MLILKLNQTVLGEKEWGKTHFAEKRMSDGSLVEIFYDVETGRAIQLTLNKSLNFQPLSFQEINLTENVAKYLFITPLEEQEGANPPMELANLFYEGSYIGKDSGVKYEIFHMMIEGKEVLIAIGGGQTAMKILLETHYFEELDKETGTLEFIHINIEDKIYNIDVAEYFNNKNL